MHGDKIYCFTCKNVTLDINPIKIQDSRFNLKWNDRCVHCLSFKTVNATMFLEKGNTEIHIPISKNMDKEVLVALGNKLKKIKAIKEFRVMRIRKDNYCLYDRRRVRRELETALKGPLGRERKL